MDAFYLLGTDGSGYDAIPSATYDLIILHHVVEHMPDPLPILAEICGIVSRQIADRRCCRALSGKATSTSASLS